MPTARLFGRVKTNLGGFTLIEVLLVIAIITIVTSATIPIYINYQQHNAVNLTSNTLSQYLYQAQIYSRAETDSCGWGVYATNQLITLFCGDNYATRNTNYDLTYQIPSSITVSGINEFDYSKLYGLPNTTGTLTISGGGNTVNLNVNVEGMVDY